MKLGRRALARRLLACLLPAVFGLGGGLLARGDLVISRGWVLRRDDLAGGRGAGKRRRA